MARPWLFDLGALFYGIMTAQATWRSSCARLVRYLPQPVNGKLPCILDLGCGPGVSTIILARGSQARLIGLDLAPRMLSEAERYTKAAPLNDRIDYVRADAMQLPFSAGSLDAVTGHSFLYMVPNRRHVVSEAFRVLRRGGVMASMEPFGGKVNWFALLRRWREVRYVISVALWRPYSWLHGQLTIGEFCEILQGAGLSETKTEMVQDGFGIIGSGVKP